VGEPTVVEVGAVIIVVELDVVTWFEWVAT
jgi:hypothetical protein